MNYLPITKHIDNRRTLIEWISDFPIRTCKVLIIHSDLEIGNHYHKEKEEIFYLLKGKGTLTVDGEEKPFKENDVIHIPKNTKHTFKLKKGSILLGAGTSPFNQNDDYED